LNTDHFHRRAQPPVRDFFHQEKSMQIHLPAFGTFIPGQGARFAAIMRGPTVDGQELPPYALLVSEKETEIERATWGKYGKTVERADSRTNGKANTAVMLVAECPAAVLAAAIEADEHKDFYLPSLGELNAAAANVPELFDGKGLYWTSTQGSRNYAFVQYFENGYSYWGSKDDEFRVRAVRQIPLELLIA
jgi:hypothetical protein